MQLVMAKLIYFKYLEDYGWKKGRPSETTN